MASSGEDLRQVLEAVQASRRRRHGRHQGSPGGRRADDHGSQDGGGEEAAEGGGDRRPLQGRGHQGLEGRSVIAAVFTFRTLDASVKLVLYVDPNNVKKS